MFEDAGCPTLETEYKPAKSRWRYICDCGEVKEILPHDFKRGRRCRECGLIKLCESIRMNREAVEKLFEDTEDTLIEYWLQDSRTIVKYLCINGHEMIQKAYSYAAGHRCSKCATELAKKRYRLSLEEVKDIFTSQDCELLEEKYINYDSKLRYRCTCGNISYSYIGAIRKGIKCGCQRLRGEDSPNWNEDLTEEQRLLARNYPEYRDWVQLVYRRDDYTCQKCRKRGGRLNAHHIKGYADYPELRTDVDNGITLCEECHQIFHKSFGYTKFTAEDLIEFMEINIYEEETIT